MNAIRILILSFLIPAEFGVVLGTLFISPYRFVLLALAPYTLWLIFRKAKRINWNSCDVFACTIFIWPVLAFGVNTSLGSAIESGGILALEMSIPYFLVRLKVNSYKRRKEFSHSMFLVVVMLFISGIPESITGHYFIREIAGNLTGFGRTVDATEQRLGIWRAVGPTDHPILFGAICASITAVAISLALRKMKYWIIVICAIGGAVISASSAPILSVLAQLGLLAWAFTFKAIKRKWLLFLACFAVAYIAINFLSNRDPIQVMFTYLLINPETGYARYYMWINSFQVVAQTDIGMFFGYGYDTSIFDVIEVVHQRVLMQHTVDSYWLVQLLRYGITMIVFFGIFLVLVFNKTFKKIKRIPEKKDRMLLQAWLFSAIAMTLIATTVHFWNQMSSIYMMVLAICVSGASQTYHRKKSHSS